MMKGKGWEPNGYIGKVGLESAKMVDAPIKGQKGKGGKVKKGTDLRAGK